MKFSYLIFFPIFFISIQLPFSAYGENIENKYVKVIGQGCFVYGDDDSPSKAKKRALIDAKRNAIENYKSFVQTKSSMKNFSIEKDLVDTLAAGYLYRISILEQKEQGRNICTKIQASVKPDEINELIEIQRNLQQKGALAASKDSSNDCRLLSGTWDAEAEPPAKSFLENDWDKNKIITWTYSTPETDKDTWTGVYLSMEPVSFENQKIDIILDSQNGHPIYVRIYSYVPGFSKLDDHDTLVPLEILVSLKKNKNLVEIFPSKMIIPPWWSEEMKTDKNLKFNFKKVLGIELSGVAEDELGYFSDTIQIESICLEKIP